VESLPPCRARPRRLARHHHPLGPQGRARRHGGRRAGLPWANSGQGQCAEGPANRRRAGAGGLRRRHGRRLHPARAAGGEAGALPRPAGARLRRARQGLAERPLPAPAGGAALGRGWQAQPAADRAGRRAGTRGCRDRHRLGRQFRPCRGPRPAAGRGALGRGHRAPGDGDRGRHLRLHERQHRRRNPGSGL
ncbi:MAG: ATP-dependent protease subunit HslV, partial [uncultured Craurococcus sp.]